MTTMWGREREPKNAEISLIRGGIPELLEEVSIVIAREKLDLEYPERKPIKLRVENGEVFAITNAFSKRALGNMKCSEETEDFKSLSSIVENKSLGPSREELIAEIEEKIVEKQRSI